MTVRARLREVLDAAGDKPSDAARKTKVPYSTIHEILSGKARAPTGETLKKIAEVYDVTVGWLLGIEGQSGDYEKRVARQVLKESAPEYGGADEPTRERETAALDSANRAYALIAHLEVELGTNRIQLPDAFGMAKDESEASAFNAEERQTIIEWMNRIVRRATSGSAAITIPALRVTGRATVSGGASVKSTGSKSEPAATAPPPSSAELESGHEDAADAVHDAESPGPTTRKERPGRSAAGDRGA